MASLSPDQKDAGATTLRRQSSAIGYNMSRHHDRIKITKRTGAEKISCKIVSHLILARCPTISMKKIFSLLLTVLGIWLPLAMGILMLAGAIWLRNLQLAITGLIVVAVASLFGCSSNTAPAMRHPGKRARRCDPLLLEIPISIWLEWKYAGCC